MLKGAVVIAEMVYWTIVGMVFASVALWIGKTIWRVRREMKDSVIKQDFVDLLLDTLINDRRA